MKKIVIIPTFCESHLIECQIPNIIDTINPDYIIYNEGMFPNGTEGNKQLTKEWLDKYTLNGEGKRGFDFLELETIINKAQQKYPNTKIILNQIDYFPGMSSTDCYIKAATNFEQLGIKVEEGDYIFPYEGDVFHHEDDIENIKYYLEQIKPGEGFRSMWIDYMQNFWYADKRTIKTYLLDQRYHHENNYMSRRICFRYDKGGIKYLNMLKNFMTTNYHDPIEVYGILYHTDLITNQYAWIRPGKFRDLRCDQLQRHPGYWENFVKGLDMCDEYKFNEIRVRPGLKGYSNEFVKFFSEHTHPKHIKKHPLWTNLDKDVINSLRNLDDIKHN